VLTIGELRIGITLFSPHPVRRAKLESFLASAVRTRFDGRILPVDSSVAERWGLLTARAKTEKNHILPVIDGLFATTAQHHNLALVTHNAKDVARTGVQLFNPLEG
jgi:predicted nucleic acid-binding protein